MPKQTQEKITANLDFVVNDTVVLTIQGQKFSPLEYQYLLTQAEGIHVRVTRGGLSVPIGNGLRPGEEIPR